MIFLSKHISLYALSRLKWILDIIWPLNQHFKLKNQKNWLKHVWMLKFWDVINCIFVHWRMKLTLVKIGPRSCWMNPKYILLCIVLSRKSLMKKLAIFARRISNYTTKSKMEWKVFWSLILIFLPARLKMTIKCIEFCF